MTNEDIMLASLTSEQMLTILKYLHPEPWTEDEIDGILAEAADDGSQIPYEDVKRKLGL